MNSYFNHSENIENIYPLSKYKTKGSSPLPPKPKN